jgi:drug/metabolite transporter (DMT)-like permease
MAKLIVVLLVALVLEAIGVVLLDRGIEEIGGLKKISAPELWRSAKAAATNRSIWGGLLLEAGFFACLVFMMSRHDVSLIWPLTGLSMVFTTLAARFIRHEQVGYLRWSGIILITIGAVLVGWSQQLRKPLAPASVIPASKANGE